MGLCKKSEEILLCVPCAEKRKADGWMLRRLPAAKDNKVTCADCGARRFGAPYTALGKSEG